MAHKAGKSQLHTLSSPWSPLPTYPLLLITLGWCPWSTDLPGEIWQSSGETVHGGWPGLASGVSVFSFPGFWCIKLGLDSGICGSNLSGVWQKGDCTTDVVKIVKYFFSLRLYLKENKVCVTCYIYIVTYSFSLSLYHRENIVQRFKPSGMWCRVTGQVFLSVLNDHSAFTFKIKQSKKKNTPLSLKSQEILAQSQASHPRRIIFTNTATSISNLTAHSITITKTNHLYMYVHRHSHGWLFFLSDCN